MKTRYTDEQIIAMIKEQESGEKTTSYYNWRRPHSALGNLTPMEFLQRMVIDKMTA